MQSPFPYFGGKRRVADMVWRRFGDVPSYVEPFFGSGAVLLSRPGEPGIETVNDADGLVSNFWRALQAAPDDVARHADWPVNENDLHARHHWLVQRKDSLQARLEGDPDYYDAKMAGWWVWGMACWIGGGFCSGNGPWHVVDVDGAPQLVRTAPDGDGIERKRVHVGNAGRGVKRKLPHVGDGGRGVNREGALLGYMRDLADRLRRVRVCCGDWSRVMGDAVLLADTNLTGVFLDPPYSAEAGRDNTLYRIEHDSVAHDCREWALAHGDDPRYRIALCGYEGEHAMPDSWECVAWKSGSGYGGKSAGGVYANAGRERVWFSPHCLKPSRQAALFGDA